MKGDFVGKLMSPKEVIARVERDISFYKRSGGGLTLSGGEPTQHSGFVSNVIELARERKINTAIETCGYQKWIYFWEAIENIDHILFDVKTMNDDLHKKYIGVSNKNILENLSRAARKNKEIIVRVPVIPGFNEDLVELEKIAKYSKENGIEEINFLPYHSLGSNKYELLGREYKMPKEIKVNRNRLNSWSDELTSKYKMIIKVI